MHNQNDNNKRFTTDKSSIKKKRFSTKKKQLVKSKLDKNVLKNEQLLNKKLFKIAKKSNIYEHHNEAFYVFSYQSLLYHEYKYLLNIQNSNRTFIITENDKQKFMNFMSAKELYWLHLNIFNMKEVSCKYVLKINKDVHNNTTDIYVLSVTKFEKQQIDNMNCYMLMKLMLSDHLNHNIEKSDTEKKKQTFKQQAELKKTALCLVKWKVEVDKLEKAIIYVKTDNITMKRDQLKKNNIVLTQKLMNLVDFYLEKTAKYDQLFAQYINLQKEHINLRQQYNNLQHTQKY